MKGEHLITGVRRAEKEIIQELRDMLKIWAKTYGVRCRLNGGLEPVDSDTLDILSYRCLEIIKNHLAQEAFLSVQKLR